MAADTTERQKVLMTFLGASDQELDPIRIMKGMFVLASESPVTWLSRDARYKFEPYHYGPCSFEVYRDLDLLVHLGYLCAREAPGQSWKYYSLTSKGQVVRRTVAKSFDPKLVDFISRVRDFVGSLSFRDLLSVIYRKYPEFAVNSVFKS